MKGTGCRGVGQIRCRRETCRCEGVEEIQEGVLERDECGSNRGESE